MKNLSVMEKIGLPKSWNNQNTTLQKEERKTGAIVKAFCVLKMGRTGSSIDETRART